MSEIIFIIDSEEELPISVWSYLVKRMSSFKCAKCDTNKRVISHHITSVYDGGKCILSNGVALCSNGKCHPKSRHHSTEYYQNKKKQHIVESILKLDPTRIESDLIELPEKELWNIFLSFSEEKIVRMLAGNLGIKI